MKEHGMMMKSFLMPMVIDESKWKSRRIGERWKKVNIGERVWMREAFKFIDWDDNGFPLVQYTDGSTRWVDKIGSDDEAARIHEILMELSDNKVDGKACDQKWRPAVHMPRSVCRFVGEVVGVRQEYLQDITEADAIAEGLCSLTGRDLYDVFSMQAVNMAMRRLDEVQRVDLIQNWNSPAYRFAVLMELMTPGIWAKNPVVTVVEWRKV